MLAKKSFSFIDMKKIVVSCLTFFFFAHFAISSSDGYKVVCYLGSWANYRNGDGKFLIEDIDPLLCTHLIYGFTKLSGNKITVYDPYLDLKENYGLGAFDRFNNLRDKHPGLKTLIAIGGWNEGSTKYSAMASNWASRKTFVDSCVQFLLKYEFDGLDLDWEYPANRGGKPEDKGNFALLIKELKEAFRPHGFLLTAAVSAGHSTIDSAYDIPALGRHLDFINLMTYDFHGGWDKFTGHNAPLYATDSDTNKKFNVDYAVRYWLSNGVPSEKLILGMALYGRNFKLQDPKNNGIGAPVTGSGMAGEYTQQGGMLGYNEICKILKSNGGWKVVVDPNIQAPYAVKDREWIGYDDPDSIAIKVRYLKKMKLGGGMVWSLETDDFRGRCHGQKYPLLRAINEGLNGGTVEPPSKPDRRISVIPSYNTSTSTRRTTSLPQTTSRDNSIDTFPCPYSGYFRHPNDCKLFYYCQPKKSATSQNTYYMFRCSEGTVFSQEIKVCTYPSSVPGCS